MNDRLDGHQGPDSDERSEDGDEPVESSQGEELQLSSWVLDLRRTFSDRAPLLLPAGVEGSEDLPRVVFLVALCVVDEALSVVLVLDDLGAAPDQVLEARLPTREALEPGESGEDPRDTWFEPLDWFGDADENAPDSHPDDDASAGEKLADPVWGAAAALVREHLTEEIQVALQVGELDDQFLVGRRCVGCVVALPRLVVQELLENESAMVVPLHEVRDPEHIEEELVVIDGMDELVRQAFLRGRRVPGSAYAILEALLSRLESLDDLEEAE